MNKNGSKGILEDSGKEKMLRSFIVEFDEMHNLKSKVSYKDIFEFVHNCYSMNRISFYPSYTWWKTKGKYLVDEYNVVKKKTIQLGESERLDLVEIFDLVEKYCGDKEALIKYLSPYNQVIERLVDRINKLDDMVKKLTSTIKDRESIIEKNLNIIKNQEELIDNLFYIHVGTERELKDILKLGKCSHDILNCSLTDTFGSPDLYLEQLKKRIILESEFIVDEENNSNIIKFQGKKNNVLDRDSYDW